MKDGVRPHFAALQAIEAAEVAAGGADDGLVNLAVSRRTTCSRRLNAPPSHTRPRISVSVQRARAEWSPVHSITIATSSAGAPTPSAVRKTRRSCVMGGTRDTGHGTRDR